MLFLKLPLEPGCFKTVCFLTHVRLELFIYIKLYRFHISHSPVVRCQTDANVGKSRSSIPLVTHQYGTLGIPRSEVSPSRGTARRSLPSQSEIQAACTISLETVHPHISSKYVPLMISSFVHYTKLLLTISTQSTKIPYF